VNRTTLKKGFAPAALVLAAALALSACGSDSDSADAGSGVSGSVRVDGSSTVAPLASFAAEKFQEANSGARVTVGTSGTGGGFEKFCKSETDVNNASRPIKDEELAICEANGVETTELQVAVDAITVVVNKDNDFATCLTTEQLKKIWEPDSKVTNWNQVDASFPDLGIKLYGPGTDSGTFDYFTDEINGEEGASRTDYNPSEDDNIIVQGVEGDKGSLGYFGFTYYEENADKLSVVQIDSGDGCVAPSVETAQDGTYTPLSRPLFVYPSHTAIKENAAAKAFVDYFVQNDTEIAEEAAFIPLNEEQRAKLTADWAKAQQ
jgi:phosphate transport system substrate-binding protein